MWPFKKKEPVFCVDCRHVVLDGKTQNCGHPMILNSVSKTADQKCWVARNWDHYCGKKGRFYEVQP